MTPDLKASAARLQDWTRGALVFWEGVQEPSGAWPEELHADGTPHTAKIRRHRVQARQVYTYALATRLGWHDGREVVRRTVDFMWEAGWTEGGMVHRLHADGTVADGTHDLYDHAFYVLALGWAEAVAGGQMERIAEVTAFIDGLAMESGGYAEDARGTLPRRQNPHMHLFEACLNLHRLGVLGDWWARAETLLGLFRERFYEPRAKVVGEFFAADWTPVPGDVEPGHGCEWVWLLGLWARTGGVPLNAIQDRLYQNALLSGGVWLWDVVDRKGEAVRETSRLWVQTELVKAHLAMAERGVAGAADMAAAGVNGLLAEWLEARGTWVDKRGACGQRIGEAVPTSTFYHVITMAAEVARVAGVTSANASSRA